MTGAGTVGIRTVGVCGAGTMGSGIAIVAARAGYGVVLHDTQEASLERARRQTVGFFERSVERGKLTRDTADAALAACTATAVLDDLAPCDLVLEAGFERLDMEREMFRTRNGDGPEREDG